MKLQGKITISRPQWSDGTETITIRLQDENSRIEFVEARMTLQAFAQAITGLGHRDVELEMHGLDLVGKRIEHKEELVFVPGESYEPRHKKFAQMAIEAFELDGWKGSLRDADNSKRIAERRSDGNVYTVGFVRYVQA